MKVKDLGYLKADTLQPERIVCKVVIEKLNLGED